MVATVAGIHLGLDTHANRPAGNAVPDGSIYSCSTHALIYRSNFAGNSWATWATLGGGAASSVAFTPTGTIAATDVQAAIAEVASEAGSAAAPGWVAAFVGSTDATKFYWDGNDLASFTAQTVTGSATWSEGQNLASVLLSNQTADDAAAQLIAKTINIGDAWTVAVNTMLLASDVSNTTTGNRSAGIIFTDGTGTTANCVAGHIQATWDNSSRPLLVGRHGTLTAMSTAPWVSQAQGDIPGGWLYIRLTYQASNSFRLAFSPDGVTYSVFGEADIAKTMTPTHVGIVGWAVNPGSAIATFGPLKEV